MTNKSMTKKTLEFDSEREFHKLYAEEPKNLQLMEESLGCKVVARGTCLTLEGKEQSVQQGEVLFRLLEQAKKQGLATKSSDFLRFLTKVSNGKASEIEALIDQPLVLKIRKNPLFQET